MLSSWVGYDTDGRNDIEWWDTLRFRLRMKRMQLERLTGQLRWSQAKGVLEKLERAGLAVEEQIAACPQGQAVNADAVARFAAALVGRRDEAFTSAAPVIDELYRPPSRQRTATRE